MAKKQNRVPEGATCRPKSHRLMGQVSEVIQYFHYRRPSIVYYSKWIRAYIEFNDPRHPGDNGKTETGRFLSYLAINRQRSISTQNQGLNSILFLYMHVLHLTISNELSLFRSKKPIRVAVVLGFNEVQALPGHMDRTWGLMDLS